LKDTETPANVKITPQDRSKLVNAAESQVTYSGVYATAVDDANQAATEGKTKDWMRYLNLYMERFNTTPLYLHEKPGPLLGRLRAVPVAPVVQSGPLVSVIMVAFNAEETVEYSVMSILGQTWRSLEFIVVDDGSTDRTWSILMSLSQRDDRIKLIQNPVQVGPYVSRNRALDTIAGAYVTVQDADDWSLPRRLEIQVRNMLESSGRIRANMLRMLRIQQSGFVSTMIANPDFSPDGVARQAYVSAMYEVRTLREKLGYWDSVWYSADGELILRAKKLLGRGFAEIPIVGAFLADRPDSVGKQGYDPSDSSYSGSPHPGSAREQYREAFSDWHKTAHYAGDAELFLTFPLYRRPFFASRKMVVDIKAVCSCLRGTQSQCNGEDRTLYGA
jgi:glycosyltransferase involved in cell wall biosynthesis